MTGAKINVHLHHTKQRKMKITRQTMRADGLTVGEAMDRDAAFLRSIGVDAKDGEPTIYEMQEALKEKFRIAVLDALDSVCANKKGWEDKDLTNIFPGIDRHSEEMFWRLWENGNKPFLYQLGRD